MFSSQRSWQKLPRPTLDVHPDGRCSQPCEQLLLLRWWLKKILRKKCKKVKKIAFSYIGRVGGVGRLKGQAVNLGSPDCLRIGMILHEVLHALGKIFSFWIPILLQISQVLFMSTQDQTGTSTSLSFPKMCNLTQFGTSKKWQIRPTMIETHLLTHWA